MDLQESMRPRLGRPVAAPALVALLLVSAMAGSPFGCGGRWLSEEPRGTPDELLRWSQLSKAGREHRRFGHLEQAEKELGAALELSRSFRPSDARRISTIGNLRLLAVSYWNAGRSRDFLRLMQRLIPECREVPGSQTDPMAEALLLFGSLQRKKGELTASREALELALSIRRQNAGEGDMGVAQMRREAGLTWIELGDLSRAEQEIDTASGIVERVAGRDSPSFASVLVARAKLLEAQANIDASEAELLRATEIDRAAVGPSHAETLSALLELSRFYQRNGRPADAEATLKEIVATEGERDDESPRYARSLNELALFYIEAGRPGEAESQARRALEILEKKSVAGVRRATLLDTLAASLQRQGRHAEAEQEYLEALEETQEERGAGADRFEEIAGHYAELLRLVGREEEAESILRKLREPPSSGGESGPDTRAEAVETD